MEHFKKQLHVGWLLAILLLAAMPATAQKEQRVTMQFNGEPLTTVFRQLEKATNYKFIFTYDDVNAYVVNGSVKNANIQTVMDYILRDKPLKYTIDDRIVSIQRRQGATAEKKEIRGLVVYDDDGEPVIGATVKVVGTDLTTITNE